MAYSEVGCWGTAVDGGTIPFDFEDGPCKEILVEVGSATVSAGGQSASFACV